MIDDVTRQLEEVNQLEEELSASISKIYDEISALGRKRRQIINEMDTLQSKRIQIRRQNTSLLLQYFVANMPDRPGKWQDLYWSKKTIFNFAPSKTSHWGKLIEMVDPAVKVRVQDKHGTAELRIIFSSLNRTQQITGPGFERQKEHKTRDAYYTDLLRQACWKILRREQKKALKAARG